MSYNIWGGLTLPIEFGSLEECEGSHHIGTGKGEGVFDAAIYMTLGGQVDDAINLLFLEQLIDTFEITDVHLDKLVIGFVFYIFEIGQVACIGQFIQIDDFIVWVLIDKEAYDVATNKACTAGDDDTPFH